MASEEGCIVYVTGSVYLVGKAIEEMASRVGGDLFQQLQAHPPRALEIATRTKTPIGFTPSLFIFLCRSKKPLDDDTISPCSVEPSVLAVDPNLSEAVFGKQAA